MFKKSIDFIKASKIVLIIYGAILTAGIVLFAIFGVGMDINFSGGTRFTYTYVGELNVKDATAIIQKNLGDKRIEVSTSQVLNSDTKKLVVTLASEEAVETKVQANILSELKTKFKDNKLALGDSNTVNPTVAGSFFAKSIYAVAIAAGLVLIYVGFRFRKIGGISAGLTALLALLIDCAVAFTTCVIFRLDIDTNFMAVILTILGYSLNDTIVIYDRIRENNKLMPNASLGEKVNVSINQSLGRSIMTSVSTFVAILAVVIVSEFFGLSSLRSFAIPMAVGVISGCCSTIFVAVPLWYHWNTKFPRKSKKR